MAKKAGTTIAATKAVNTGKISSQAIKATMPPSAAAASQVKNAIPLKALSHAYVINIDNRYYEGPDPIQNNEKFRELTEEGLSNQRPEIIASIDFIPAFHDPNEPKNVSNKSIGVSTLAAAANKLTTRLFTQTGELTSLGKLLQMQIWAQGMLNQNMFELIGSLKSYDELKQSIENREADLVHNIDLARQDVEKMFVIVEALERAKTAFDVKRVLAKIPDGVTKSLGSISNVMPPKAIFNQYLYFSDKNYENFTNTKILLQSLFDLKYMLQVNSHQLLDNDILQRKNDADPINLNTNIDVKGAGFSFDLSILASNQTSPIDATKFDYHMRFLNSLPSQEDKRIKLLLTSLSKTMRISAVQGSSNAMNLIRHDFADVPVQGDPFEAIIGSVGNSITSRVTGQPRSLVRQVQFSLADTSDNKRILPFEDAYIGQSSIEQKQRVSTENILKNDSADLAFSPGTSYFIDSITDMSSQKSLEPLDQYVNLFDQSVNATINAVSRFLQLPEYASDKNDIIIDKLRLSSIASMNLTLLKSQLENIRVHEYPIYEGDIALPGTANKPSPGAIFISALANEAQRDPVVKNLLFRFLILDGIVKTQQNDDDTSFFVDLSQSNDLGLTGQATIEERSAAIESLTSRIIQNYSLGEGESNTSQVTSQLALQYKQSNEIYAEPDFFVLVFTHEQISNMLNITTGGAAGVGSMHEAYQGSWIQSYMRLLELFNSVMNATHGKINQIMRHGSLSLTTWALMLFEAVLTTTAKYVPTFFTKSKVPNAVWAVLNTKHQAYTMRAISAVYRRLFSKNKLAAIGNLSFGDYEAAKYSEILSITQGIMTEDDGILAILNMFKHLNDVVKTEMHAVRRAFGFKTKAIGSKSSHAKILDELNASAKGKSNLIINRSQVMLAHSLLYDIEERIGLQHHWRKTYHEADKELLTPDKAYIIDDEIPREGMVNAMFSMLREEQFVGESGRDSKAIAVGIPAGFSDYLKKRLTPNKVSGDTFTTKAADVIAIDVYKRDEQYDGIAFKPKRFLFELSRFVSNGTDISVGEATNFSAAKRAMKIRDYSFDVIRNINQSSSDTSLDMIDNQAYDFLSKDEIDSLLHNHAVSVLMQMYIKLTTGLSLYEKTFMASPQNLVDARNDKSAFFENLATVQLSKTAGKPIDLKQVFNSNVIMFDQLLVQPADDLEMVKELLDIPGTSKSLRTKMTEDMRTFAKLYSAKTMLADGDLERQRIIGAKLYERIFVLYVNSNDFEIDTVASNSEQLNAAQRSGLVVNIDKTHQKAATSFIRRSAEDGHVIFEKYFVTIETLDNMAQVRNVQSDSSQLIASVISSNKQEKKSNSPAGESKVKSKGR